MGWSSIDNLPLEADIKLNWSPKLYKLFKVSHSRESLWEISEITDNSDPDYKFMTNTAIYNTVFPEKWEVLRKSSSGFF